MNCNEIVQVELKNVGFHVGMLAMSRMSGLWDAWSGMCIAVSGAASILILACFRPGYTAVKRTFSPHICSWIVVFSYELVLI